MSNSSKTSNSREPQTVKKSKPSQEVIDNFNFLVSQESRASALIAIEEESEYADANDTFVSEETKQEQTAVAFDCSEPVKVVESKWVSLDLELKSVKKVDVTIKDYAI